MDEPVVAAKPIRKPATKVKPKRKRRPTDPAKAWAKRLERTRPELMSFVLDGLASAYGQPLFERVHDPTTELVLTILRRTAQT